MLQQRADERRPLRVLLIGAGKFGSMFLAQARRTPGMHIVAVADLSPRRALESLARTGCAWRRARRLPDRHSVNASSATSAWWSDAAVGFTAWRTGFRCLL